MKLEEILKARGFENIGGEIWHKDSESIYFIYVYNTRKNILQVALKPQTTHTIISKTLVEEYAETFNTAKFMFWEIVKELYE